MLRKLLSVLVGFVLLAAALTILWVAHGPLPTEARITGGILYTQAEIAAQTLGGSAPELSAITDTTSGPVSVPILPQFAGAALSDLSQAEAGEQAGGEQVTGDVATGAAQGGVPLTTDVLLDSATGVTVAAAPQVAGALAPEGMGGMEVAAAGYEQRVVELEWPAQFQVGRAGLVRIKLKMLDSGALQPVAEIADNEVMATPILLTDRYATHDAFVTASIVAPDFKVEAVNPAVQPLQRGGEAEWRWMLTADRAGKAVISLGLSISWQPKPGQPPGPTNVPIWGQALQVEASYVFGLLTVPQSSVAGTVLAVLGVVAEIPLLEKFLGLFWRILFGRRRRRNSSARRR
ncbi:MAG: hypothetical protein Kow00106_10010 [Anaerolineae bacterium]